ncbi:hypothetical protein TVAG_268310 [Trichomonas vaginalis G3]|uniref:Dynein light intermediate chain n=1 Tax=Trichomonas vaginalis (strain ATCC PRA-98 / G3) TaxID=412133 RepID=A2DLI0_TRIV3|nr:dynein light intermediate chain family [Trichomonas vaginalis G3]EAY18798.1 hypothetical protein TVAG_268310 [Trichomonas vaginalis G3]KAI5539263.1 dynein light intermediate chain family [Trichomonas vaginalis G3]|eukprot:XP_001579784.1 hypothetical protein [Trichomonas vaginalis G3]
MNDSLTKLLDLARGALPELTDCYFFLIGRHGSGKSSLIANFSPEVKELQSRSTFGYEYTDFVHDNKYLIHIYEFNDTAYNNLLFDLIKENIDKSCIIFTFDINHPTTISTDVTNIIAPLYTSLNQFFENTTRQKDLEKYYSTICSKDPINHSQSTMKINTYVPTVFVGTFDESLEDLSDPKFDGYMNYLREAAIPYGASITLSKSKIALELFIYLSLREQISEFYWDKVCERTNYFIPPAWDSIEKVEAVEKEVIEEAEKEIHESDEIKVQDYNSFLSELAKNGHIFSTTSRKKFMSPEKLSSAGQDDYLKQFM